MVYTAGIALLIPMVFLAGVWAMLELLGRNVLFINVRNYSHKYIENVVVSDSNFSSGTPGMGVPGSWGFYTSPRLRFKVRVAFNVEGQHYDIPADTWLLPFGRSSVTLSIGEGFKLKLDAKLLQD